MTDLLLIKICHMILNNQFFSLPYLATIEPAKIVSATFLIIAILITF